jgi:acetyl esterase/lipase
MSLPFRLGACGLLALALAACSGRPAEDAASSGPSIARAQEPEEEARPTAPPEPPGAPRASAPPVRALPPRVDDCVVPEPGPGVRIREAVVYARPRGPLRLDLALPPGGGPHPVVLLVHGGGWSAGERIHLRDEMRILAGLGYAAASIDYRLMDHGAPNRFPAAVADARCAVRYLRRNAADLGLDAERMAAVGFSAGGHLAQMLATAPDVEGLDAGCGDVATSPAVRAAIAYYAPSDLRPAAPFGRAADRIITRFLGATRRARPDRAALASPIAHVDGRDAAMLLVHGTADTVVPVNQSRRMRAALSHAGVPVRYVEIPDAPHGFRMFGRRLPVRPGTCTSLAFLRATLR